MTPAERQAKSRAIKKGTYYTIPSIPCDLPPHLLPNGDPNPFSPHAALPAPQPLPALPAPPETAIQKKPASPASALARPEAPASATDDDGLRMSLPPAVAARLHWLLDRHEAGKTLTAAERAEAQGLIDIADYFAVQRLRNRLAA
jgi:hypothetical protein